MRFLFSRGVLYMFVFVAQAIATTLVTPFITRLLGGQGFGQVAAAIAIGSFAAALTGLGLSIGIQRSFADRGVSGTRVVLTHSYVLISGLTAVLIITCPLWATAVGFDGSVNLLACALAWAGFTAATLVSLSFLRTQDKLASFATVGCSQALGSQAMGIVFLLLFGRTALHYMVGILIGTAVTFFSSVVVCRPAIRGVSSLGPTRATLAYCTPLVPHAVALLTLNLGDRIILQRDLGPEAVGRYQLAYNAGSYLILLISMLNQSWEPRLLATKSRLARNRLLRSSSTQLSRLLAPLLLATCLFAPITLRILAPASFGTSSLVIVTAVVAIAVVPYAAYLAQLRVVLTGDRTRSMIIVAPIAAIFNIVVNLIVIPHFQLLGAAWVTFASYVVLWLGLWFTIRHRSHIQLGDRPATLLLLGAALAGLASTEVATTTIILVVRVVLTAGCLGWFTYAGLRLRRQFSPATIEPQ